MDITSYLLGKQAGGGGGSTPILQNKSITVIENKIQNITADSGYDGLRNVELTTNVQPDLENKSVTITENTTTTITPTAGKDGLSSVEIITNVSGGSDPSEYFNTEITSTMGSGWANNNLIKKIPTLNISDTVTSLYGIFERFGIRPINKKMKITYLGNNMGNCMNMFSYMQNGVEELDLSEFNTVSCTAMSSMFERCIQLKKINLSASTTANVTTMSNMFAYCSSLTNLDIRNFTFDSVTNFSNMFQNVPANCEIIVKSQTEKDWVLTQRSDFTNVKTVAEYEAE